jgi:hypothetical protein
VLHTLQKNITRHSDALSRLTDDITYALQFLLCEQKKEQAAAPLGTLEQAAAEQVGKVTEAEAGKGEKEKEKEEEAKKGKGKKAGKAPAGKKR